MTKTNDRKRRADVAPTYDAVLAYAPGPGHSGTHHKHRRLDFEQSVKGSQSTEGLVPPSDDETPTVVSSRVSSMESLSALASSVSAPSTTATVTTLQLQPKVDMLAPGTRSTAPSRVFDEAARLAFERTQGRQAPDRLSDDSELNPPRTVLRLALPVRAADSSACGDLANSSGSKSPWGTVVITENKEVTTSKPVETRDNGARRKISFSFRRTRTRRSFPTNLEIITGIALIFFAFLGSRQNLSYLQRKTNSTVGLTDPFVETVYVPGYGFSGFWYILGRLQRMHKDQDPHTQRQYYCYSAGCMGVVATLQDMKLKDVYREAVHIQNQWKSGEIDRYEVTTHFVSWLLSNPTLRNSTDTVSVERMLASLRIITSAPNGWWGVRPVIRTPASLEELHEMLIQTTWIPFATGRRIWHAGGHNDGAFTSPLHPGCDYHVGLTASSLFNSLDVLLNVVNVNLSPQKVEKFWRAGVAQGAATDTSSTIL